MVDFSADLNSASVLTVPGDLEDRIESVGKMSFDDDTNVPTNFLRFDASTPAFEKYNGSSWAQVFGAAQINHNSLLNYDSNEHTDKTANETITGNWLFNASQSFAGNIVFTADNLGVYQNTVNGADNRRLEIAAASEADSTRSAYIRLYGNEDTGDGQLWLVTGQHAEGHLVLKSSNVASEILLRPGNSDEAVRFLMEGGYPQFRMGQNIETTRDGAIMVGGKRLEMTTSYNTLATIAMSATEQVTGFAIFTFSKNNLADHAAEIIGFTAQKYSASAPSVNTSTIFSYNPGSVPIDVRVNASTNSVNFEGRNSSGVGTYDASVSVFGCAVSP